MAEIDDLLKSIDDVLANENLQTEEEKPDENQDLINQIDAAIEPPKQEAQAKEELPKATPSPLPAPAPVKEPEIDLSKPSNQVLSIIGDKDQEDFDAADLELIDGLEDAKDLYELSKARPDISLNTDQARKIFEYQRTASPYTKVPENAADWYNLTDAALEDVGDVLSMTGEMVWGGMKGAAKAVQYGTPALLGMNSTYAEALALEKKLPPEKRGEVEAWRKRAWQIANTPLKGGEQPSPDSYTDEKYLQKVKENLPPEKATEAKKTEQEFQEKRYKAKQVPYSILDELAGLPISLNFLGTKVGTGGMQTWDNISEKFGLQDKEKSFENWLARNEIDTAQAKMMKAEPRAFARVVQTYYAPAMKSFTNLLHPSVKEYMIMYPELSMEEAQAKRAEQIDSDVQTTIEDIKKDIPETDPDQAMFGGLAIPGQFGLDNFGFAYNVLSATKQLTPLVRTKLRQMRYTDDQINAFEKQAQQALRAKELKRLEKLEKPGLVERAAGATARGIEKVGDYFERSPTWQKIGKATPVVSGAMLGYQLDPENPLQSLAVGSLGGAVGIPVAKQTLKTITEIPKSIKEISAARRISAGGSQGPLATLKTIAQQQDEVKTLSAKLKTYAEGTDDYIETEKLLKDAKDKLKGIKAGGTDVIDYQGIGKVSDTTKRILRFVNDDMVSNIGEYAKLGVEPTLVGLATGIIDSSDEEELKTMIGQGLAFSLGGRAVQQSFNKFIGEDPVIAARKSRQANVDAFKAYRDSSPETRGEIDQLTDWDNVINRQSTKAEKAQIALQELQAKGADPAKIAEAQKAATAEQKSLSLLKTANVQTRNEFGRQFLQQLGRNNMLLNGSLKAGQNNVGFHILSTQQIFDHFRKNPAFANVPDDVILTYAGQSGFYSGGGQQGESNMAFDPAKPAIVLNSDALRNRMEVFGETPIDALNHETGHHISRVPEIQDALGDVRKILFTNEIKDASGLTKTITNGLYTNDQLVDLFDGQYLKNRSKQEKEQIAKSLGLWDSGLNQLDKESVKNYMQEEILAEVFSNTLSRNLGKNINDKQIHLLDFARLKLKNNLLKKAAVKMLGLGMDGNVESAVTGAQITPEAQSAARNALRIMQSMNGDFSTITSQPDVPAISKADIKKSRVAAERYGMDSGLFETKTIAQVFDAAGNPIGDAVEITDPAVFEGSWRVGKDGEERLSGYGQIPIELRQLQVPEGGTLSISKQLQTEADGVTPKMLEKGELAKRIKNRAELFKKAIDTPDYGTSGRFEPVYEGAETYRGAFTPMQIQAIKELPEGIVPLKIKKYLLELNDAIVRKDGTRFFVDYAAVMDDKGNYKAFSPKIYDVVPIGLQLSSAGNFLVTTISVGRMREKLNLWADRMPGRLSPWNGSKEAFWQDFSKKYLANWAAQIEGSGYKNGVPVGNNQLDPDYQKAEEKKSILNDYLNLFTNETRPLNLDRTQIPRKQGDPKNKSADRTIMSMRVDHFAELLSGEHLPKLPIDYGKAIINFLPASAEIEAPSGERGFKSKLQTEIQRKFQGANATPEQLKAVLNNPQNVKPEEVKWSGVMDEIDRLAQENNGKVPVQALVNYLRDEGQVKFEEVVNRNISYDDVPQDYVIRRLEELLREAADDAASEDDSDPEFAYYVLSKNAGILSNFAEQARDEYINENQRGFPRFSDLQLPGGENYREVALSMPEKYTPSYLISKLDGTGIIKTFDTAKEAEDFYNNLENKLEYEIQSFIQPKDRPFQSSHFPDVPNYIAHMRLNERTDSEGNDGLFVEEFQSDRHQQGREKGYREENQIIKKQNPDGLWEVSSPKTGTKTFSSERYADRHILTIKPLYEGGIPDAPFRKDWGVQLFKRALRDAVESGKSWIGWTTGETQAERYKLSEKIEQIITEPMISYPNGYRKIKLIPLSGNDFIFGVTDKGYVVSGWGNTGDQFAGKNLSEIIGKDLTNQIISGPEINNIKGENLNIGGEGMKGFYDTILPKEIGKYVAKMGGKVEKSGIVTETPSTFTQFTRTQNAIPKTIDIPEKATPIWQVNITPEMENVVRAGQIQFMPAVQAIPERFTGTGEKGEERRGRYVAPPEFWTKFDIDEFERGGKFFDLETGEDITDKTYATGTIDVTGKRPSLVSNSIVEEMPEEKGRTWKTNLFRKSAVWEWISENPPEVAAIGSKEKPDPVLISVEGGRDHFYTLKTEFPNGVQLARYPNEGSEPRLRPTKKGQIQLGNVIGRIKTKKLEHPVYDTITIGAKFMPAVEVEAPSGERERARFLSSELDKMYAAGGTDKNINAYESELEQIYQKLDSQAEEREITTEDFGEEPDTTDVDVMNSPMDMIEQAVNLYNSGRVDEEPPQTLAEFVRSAVNSTGNLIISPDVTDEQIVAAADDVMQYRQSLKDRIRSGTQFSNAVVAPAGIQFLPAFHGSPYDFDRFRMDKVGTGRKEQAFGYGLYFSKAKRVGEQYQAGSNSGKLYKVDLDINDSDLLYWDEPFKNQSESVKNAIVKVISKRIPKEIADASLNNEAKGGSFYALISDSFVENAEGTPEQRASKTFLAAGIPGVRYLDRRSLITGKKAYNYVIFDENLIKVLEKSDQPVGPITQFMPADSEYLDLAQNPEANREQLQRMVDEAAKNAGYDVKGWHGTNADFDVFKPSKYGANGPGIYFSNDKDLASFGKRTISAWIKNPIFAGYEIIAKSPEQVKSADPVTYDDAGNVIPLSKRFQTTSPDIRFMPAEQEPQGMEGVEMPQTYRRISGMIPPLQGVEPPVAPSALPAEPETPATPALPKQVEKTMKADAGDFSVVIGGKPGKYGFEYTSVAKLQPELELSEQRKKELLETLSPRNEEFNKKRDALMEIGNLWWENNDLLNKQNKSDEDRSRMREVDQFLQEFMAKDDKEFAIDDAIQVAQVDRLTKRINELQRGITPAPFKFPTDRETALKSLQSAVATLFKTKKFKQFVASAAGLEGINFDNILGTWKFEAEPSFVFSAPGMTWDQAQTITKWLSVLMTQDAGIAWKPSIGLTEGAPSVYLVHNKKLTEDQILKAFEKAKQVGIDGLSVTVDGKGIKAANFDGIEGFGSKLVEIQKAAGIKNFQNTLVDSFYYDTTSDFTAEDGSTRVPDWLKGASINEKNLQDQQGGMGQGMRETGRDTFTGGLSVLLRGGIDSVLVPYAKSLAGEGFTFDPARFAERYGLGQEVADYIREQLYPATGLSRSVTPILEGTEKFVVPESFYTKDGKLKTSVNDLMYALQRRSADDGFIVPGDYSPRAGQIISETIVDEVAGHMERAKQNPDAPNAIGWYDAALKRMKAEYAKYFPFLNRESKDYNADKEFVFDSVLGITSQGNNVFENGKMAARIQFLLENGKTLPEIASEEFLYDTFGGQTRAIENNLLKLDELLKNNDTQTLDKIFRKKMTVSEWNAYLKKNKNFYFKGEPLSVDGQADQMVTGFSVFGPKIGSFINNLHGDYSTLTADLWYTRTWNRILGNVFQHASLKEANQYDTFRKSLLEQYRKNKTESYQRKFNPLVKKINKEGKKVLFDYLNETELEGLSENEFGELINDPQRMLDFATALEDRFRSGQYKTKSDLRRAAKNWVENRSDPVAAPRTDLERDFQQNVMEIAQKKLRRKGIDISIADMQAALWYNEKELFGLYGAQVSGAEPADYADSAENVSELMSYGTLFQLERLVDQQDGTKKKEIIRLVPYDAELGLTKIKDAKTPEEYAQLVAARKKAIEDAKSANKKLEKAELKVEETRNQLAKVDPTDQKSKQKAEVALAKAEKLLADLKPPVATPVAPLTGIKSPVE